jgi:hypothetical protein
MTYDDLIERVEWGEEFNFEYENEQYWVSQNNDGYYLTRVNDSSTQEFKTAKDLFINGRIDNKSMFELWELICDQF